MPESLELFCQQSGQLLVHAGRLQGSCRAAVWRVVWAVWEVRAGTLHGAQCATHSGGGSHQSILCTASAFEFLIRRMRFWSQAWQRELATGHA